ncbi:MarR family winged helix-turn-helix transcriptional regulator [Cohnella sp. AR92]|uniref:MarR family winged helix-turn-helix transcriptional regulator n=1 Tax=Cohnella sp. AR92 TaxID=648716 RepID=UPI000F8CBBF4|nr:MarR family transcriptional regulator [Cohnella sp. AR92]RUS49146.1 MarR family transcriptional regulator [Cohnella sp. AR92]
MEDERFARIELEIAIFMRRAEAIRLAGMSGDQLDRSAYLMLRYLEKKGPVGIKALADEMQIDISTASRQIASLEAKGFVTRASDPHDARISLLRVTEEVPGMLREARQNRIDYYAKLLGDWNPEDSLKFGELLGKFNRTAEELLKKRREEGRP